MDKKLVKKLYESLKKKPNEKVKQMADAFVGTLENEENPANSTVLAYFENFDTLMDKLNNANPRRTTEQVADKQYEVVKKITKPFIDSATEGFKDCSHYAAFLGWVTQYLVLIRYV